MPVTHRAGWAAEARDDVARRNPGVRNGIPWDSMVVAQHLAESCCVGGRYAGPGGFPHEINLRRAFCIPRSALGKRSGFKVSAARARAGSKVRVRSSHKAWRPAAHYCQ
jgi:hypothetical protein